MSRSKKHYPCCTDYSRSTTRWSKRMASKLVRRFKPDDDSMIGNHCYYKKIYEQWDIHDYCWMYIPCKDYVYYLEGCNGDIKAANEYIRKTYYKK